MFAKFYRCSGTTIVSTECPGWFEIFYKGVRIARFNTSVIKKLLEASNEGSGTSSDPDRSIPSPGVLHDK